MIPVLLTADEVRVLQSVGSGQVLAFPADREAAESAKAKLLRAEEVQPVTQADREERMREAYNACLALPYRDKRIHIAVTRLFDAAYIATQPDRDSRLTKESADAVRNLLSLRRPLVSGRSYLPDTDEVRDALGKVAAAFGEESAHG